MLSVSSCKRYTIIHHYKTTCFVFKKAIFSLGKAI